MGKKRQAATEAQSGKLAERLDNELAKKAYRKVVNGEKPTVQERAALKRYEKKQEEKRRWEYYESIPQKDWRAMSGRQTKVLNEQAVLYGIPFGGRTINLPNVVRALHDFLKVNARFFSSKENGLTSNDVVSPALERYREERAKMARLERQQLEGKLIPLDLAHEALGRIAGVLRSAGDGLRRECGARAVDILNEALDEAEREIERFFGELDDSSDPDKHDAA